MHKHKTHVQYKRTNRPRRAAEETVAQILERLFESNAGPILIAVGGPGGTGKTTFCDRLARRLPASAVLHLDDYKTPRETRRARNLYGAHPDANRIELLREHCALLKAGQSIDAPVYETVSGRADRQRRFAPARFIILDGEISSYPHFREFIDFSVFIDADWRTQLTTRISRDIEERGYTREKAITTFLQSNLREFAEHGAHSKAWADMHLYCREDYHLVVESLAEELYTQFGPTLETELDPVAISGLITPVCTPFSGADAFAETAFIEHLEFLAAAGVKKVLVNGTTGEFFSLTEKERRLALHLTRRYFPGVVLYQAGRESLVATITEARLGEDFGADAIVALPPYYRAAVPADGLIACFRQLGESIDIPLILYNFPRHTGNPLTPEILDAIEHFGLKDSSGDLSLIGHTRRYFIGGDSMILEACAAGAVGFVSGHANHAPDLYVVMERALRHDPRDAARLQEEITALSAAFSGAEQTAKIKYAVSQRIPGYPAAVRLPLCNLHEDERIETRRFLDCFGSEAPTR